MYMVVDVKTNEADVIACYIFFLLADVIANPFMVDVVSGLVPGESLSSTKIISSVLEKSQIYIYISCLIKFPSREKSFI